MDRPGGVEIMQLILKLFASPRFQKYFQNVSWLIFEKVFTLFVAMLVGIYVARYLQPERFGLLNYAISFVGIFSSLSAMGLDQIMVRELAKESSRQRELMGTGFVIRLGGFLLSTTLICIILLFMHNDYYTNTLVLIIAASEVFRAFEVVNCFYQARVMSKHVVQIQVFINFFLSFLKVMLVYIQAPLEWFAWIVLVNTILNAIGYIYIYSKREGTIFNWRFNKATAFMFLNESWPLALNGFAILMQARVDQVMLGQMLDKAEVGQYSVAMKFIEILGFIPMVLLSTFIPAITKARNADQSLYHDRLLNFYRLMFFTFIVVSVPLYLFAKDIVVTLYGAEYAEAGFLLSLFSIRMFFTNMGVAKSAFTVNESLFRYSLFTSVTGALINIGINYLLIPRLASIGAIISSVISFSITIFVIDLFMKKTRENQKLIFRGIFSFWKVKEVFNKI